MLNHLGPPCCNLLVSFDFFRYEITCFPLSLWSFLYFSSAAGRNWLWLHCWDHENCKRQHDPRHAYIHQKLRNKPNSEWLMLFLIHWEISGTRTSLVSCFSKNQLLRKNRGSEARRRLTLVWFVFRGTLLWVEFVTLDRYRYRVCNFLNYFLFFVLVD